MSGSDGAAAASSDQRSVHSDTPLLQHLSVPAEGRQEARQWWRQGQARGAVPVGVEAAPVVLLLLVGPRAAAPEHARAVQLVALLLRLLQLTATLGQLAKWRAGASA